MFEIIYPESYERKAGKFFRKHPELLKQYQRVLKILEVNPNHPSLRLHHYGGKISGLYSISINIKYRISLDLVIEEKKIILVNVGSHDEIYRNKG